MMGGRNLILPAAAAEVAALRPAEGTEMAASETVIHVVKPELSRTALPDHVLVGVDGSEASLRALDMAALVARRNESEVTVVFVRHPTAIAAPIAVDWAEMFAPLEAEIREAAAGRLQGVRWRMLVAAGAPSQELERATTEVGADLLIVGRSSGGMVHRLLEGSVGGHAATHAPVPVLVVR
jgi:nucleotide-binding universal stress UspA family protein